MKLTLSMLALLAFDCVFADARDWSDESGSYHRDGELVRFDGTKVWMREADGKVFSCQWDRLCAADKQYVFEVKPKAASVLPAANRVVSVEARYSADSSRVAVDSGGESPRVISGRTQIGGRTVPASLSEMLQAPQPPGKRIFSGCFARFQLDGATGTGSYWLRDAKGFEHHYLASLTFHGRDGSANYLVDTSVGTEGGVFGWYFYDQPLTGCCCSPVYNIGAVGSPELYESECREIPE